MRCASIRSHDSICWSGGHSAAFAANPNPGSRMGSLSIADQTFNATQAPPEPVSQSGLTRQCPAHAGITIRNLLALLTLGSSATGVSDVIYLLTRAQVVTFTTLE